MLSLRYDGRIRALLSSFALFLLLLTYALSYSQTTRARLDSCYIMREFEKPAPTTIPLRDGPLHNYSVYVMWISMFILALLPNARFRAIYSLTYTSIWFHITYILLAALKAPLFDYNCAGRHVNYPNGISGHYCYFIFVALTAPRFAQTRLRANPNASRAVLAFVSLLMALFSIGATATLYRTFFHGYHSARQIAFGTSLGIASHVLLDAFYYRDGAQPSVSVSMAFLFANSLLSLALYFVSWPHENAGPAITNAHLIFHGTLWIILLFAAQARAFVEAKVATD